MNQSNALHWAIGELAKQKEELEGKLKIARKRDETSALIEEVHAQKDALEKRIASLRDGLRVSSDLVDDQVEELTKSISTVDEKLEIAQERLDVLEQEEYLEQLGRKLNGNYSAEDSTDSDDGISGEAEFATNSDTLTTPAPPETFPEVSIEQQTSSTPVIMKSPSNRIETEEEETSPSRIPPAESSEAPLGKSDLELCQSATATSLEECAKQLGMEPEYLLNKGMQAVLRMIARNGNQISFPLEVEQVK